MTEYITNTYYVFSLSWEIWKILRLQINKELLQSLGIFITSVSKHWSRLKKNLNWQYCIFFYTYPPHISPYCQFGAPYSPPNWWRLWMPPLYLGYWVQAIKKKVCSSDVMHCQISIFKITMMVKIGVIFIPFSNPTCHLQLATKISWDLLYGSCWETLVISTLRTSPR